MAVGGERRSKCDTKDTWLSPSLDAGDKEECRSMSSFVSSRAVSLALAFGFNSLNGLKYPDALRSYRTMANREATMIMTFRVTWCKGKSRGYDDYDIQSYLVQPL